MYEKTMTAIDRHLVQKSQYSNLIYTAELIPERDRVGVLCARRPRLPPPRR
jgi:hypothetical protein